MISSPSLFKKPTYSNPESLPSFLASSSRDKLLLASCGRCGDENEEFGKGEVTSSAEKFSAKSSSPNRPPETSFFFFRGVESPIMSPVTVAHDDAAAMELLGDADIGADASGIADDVPTEGAAEDGNDAFSVDAVGAECATDDGYSVGDDDDVRVATGCGSGVCAVITFLSTFLRFGVGSGAPPGDAVVDSSAAAVADARTSGDAGVDAAAP